MSVSQDGSESVDQFLARIASVKEGRDQASQERTRRMEEDFLKNRKERQARRLERARSLSPSKTGPAPSTSIPQTSNISRDAALNPPVDFSPKSSTLSRSNAVSARTPPTLESKDDESIPVPGAFNRSLQLGNATGLSRSGTLSWQQRPSRDGGGRPRPLSTIETVRPISKPVWQQEEHQSEPTRQDIAAALGSKDPSWFRQTQDRGLGSAAFRKNQVEDKSVVEHVSHSQVLPGLSRDDSRARTMSPPTEDERVFPPSEEQPASLKNEPSREHSPALRTLPDPPKLDLSPPQAVRSEAASQMETDNTFRSSSILAGRSPSPTKGLGGFVESAMMKRSDSVNKRWSVQANAGLKRGDSVAGVRPFAGVRSMHASSISRHAPRSESPSSLVNPSRPTSRHGDGQDSVGRAASETNGNSSQAVESTVKTTEIDTAPRPQTPAESQLTRSPSKASESRRWSPTKSSWLESALISKPEPPKIQPKKEEVPAWKATLQRNKASRDLSPSKVASGTQGPQSALLPEAGKAQQPPNAGRTPDLKVVLQSEEKPLENEATRSGQHPASRQEVPVQQDPMKSSLNAPIDHENPISQQPALNPPSEKPQSDNNDPVNSGTVDTKPDRKPPVLKPKPQTPPKTDFRSSLRSRAPTAGEGSGSEPEFKSVFGKLKRAQTQNYVAPDTLKDNILQGKSSLNVTGGPQKTKRVDEFKESILQKKEAMKVSAVQKKENPAPETQPSRPEPAVPEALARRKTLHRATPSITKIQGLATTPAQAAQEQLKSVPKPAVGPKPSLVSQSSNRSIEVSDAASSSDEPLKIDLPALSSVGRSLEAAIKSDLQLRARTATGQSQASTASSSEKQQDVVPPSPQDSIITAKSELPAGSKLASRLNPSLAAFLSRGGSPRPSPSTTPPPEVGSALTAQPLESNHATGDSSSNAELTHMTKARARGPKRRAPKSQPPQTTIEAQQKPVRSTSTPVSPVVVTPKPVSGPSISVVKPSYKPQTPVKGSFDKPDTPVPARLDSEASGQGVKIQQLEDKPKVKPAVVSKSPELRRVSSTLQSSQNSDSTSRRATPEQFDIVADKETPTTLGSRTTLPEKPLTPKPASHTLPLTPSKSRVNTSRPLQATAEPPTKPQSLKPTAGLGLSSARPLAQSKTNTNVSESTMPRSSQVEAINTSSGTLKSNGAEESRKLLSSYFRSLPRNQQGLDFDAAELLSAQRNLNEKIRSISHTIWEISGGGKKAAMPTQQEHILFEESMYLLVHTFETGSGNRASEAYLWCGDQIADAAVEDAQLFCKKDAREHNAKLEVVKQGRESSRFFQALGGILIVRRSKSSSMYMLCGRRHLGHIAFDEVDISAANLCSGFAYLISAKFGKLFLWKGRGSGADEVGCARLIGMDLGLTGEIEEISEGQEPPSFWETFPQKFRDETLSSDWQQRLEHNCYPTYVYRVETDQPRQVGGFWGLRAASPPKSSNRATVELVDPFNYRDVDTTSVHVIDAYRSVYVVLSPSASDKPTEFVTALNLAQELAMLSPSIQDRSLLPACFVVFGHPPADVRMCFRKFPVTGSTKGKPSGCIKLEQVMEALKP